MKNKINKIRGVNLGGWIVFEKWITPSLFKGTEAEDEFNLHKTQSQQKILDHYKTFITEKDFKFIAESGLNSVRIPIGYWIFGDFPPFPKTIEYLDFAFDMTDKYGLKTLVDLHAAPGSQNGYDHSGVTGDIGWDKDLKNIDLTLDVISKISKRYSERESFLGIELLNEPHKEINIELLKDFYKSGYQLVRKSCGDNPIVVFNDAFRPFEWEEFIQQENFTNVAMDTHFYQCFSEENKLIKSSNLIRKTKRDWKKQINKTSKKVPVIAGEWSLELNSNDFRESISEISNNNKPIRLLKKYAQIQKSIFERSLGWFFWTYKIEESRENNELLGWNFNKLSQNSIFTV